MVRAPRKCSRARSALQRSRAPLGSEAPGCAIARDSGPMMTGPMCSCQSSGARLPVAGQEGGALDSHHAHGRVSALGRALPVLYMSPCLPRAPWAPTFGVRCCSGGSASCSPCRGLTVPAPCLLGRWLSSADLPFHGLLVCLAFVLLPFGEFTACFPGTSCVPRFCRGRSWLPVSC